MEIRGGAPKTRSQAKKEAEEAAAAAAAAAGPSRRQAETEATAPTTAAAESSSSPTKKSAPKKTEEYNRAICEKFVEDPSKNPFTDRPIDFLGASFKKYNSMCKELYGISYDVNDRIKHLLDTNIDLGTKFFYTIKYPEPASGSNKLEPAKVRDYFKEQKGAAQYVALGEPGYEYLNYAFNYVGKIEYINKIKNHLYESIKDDKEKLVKFINNITTEEKQAGRRNTYSTIKIQNINIKIQENNGLYNRIIANARQHKIVRINFPAFNNYTAPDHFSELEHIEVPTGTDYITMSAPYLDFRRYVVDFIMHENQPKKVLEDLIEACDEVRERDYLNTQFPVSDKTDFDAIIEELESILDQKNVSTRSIRDISSARSSNRSKSLSFRAKENLPELPKKTRAELLDDILAHSKEEMDVITLRKFSDMKKKDLQLVVRIGPKTRDNRQSSYNVVSIYKKINEDVKEGLPPTDPLNPGHVIKEEEMRDIQAKMQYYSRGAPRPDDIKRYTYPKVVLVFEQQNYRFWYRVSDGEGEGESSRVEPFYAIIIKHIIGNRATDYDRIWGVLPDIEIPNRPDLNTGVIIAKLRDMHDKGRLLQKMYTGENSTLRFQPRVHINKPIAYWSDRTKTLSEIREDRIRKLELMKEELDRY
jgi:2-cysteine adaptor domain